MDRRQAPDLGAICDLCFFQKVTLMFNVISLNMEVFSVFMIKIINTEIDALDSSF